MVWNSAEETTGIQGKVVIPVTIPIGLSLMPLPGLGDSREAKIAESALAARVFLDINEKFRTIARMGVWGSSGSSRVSRVSRRAGILVCARGS